MSDNNTEFESAPFPWNRRESRTEAIARATLEAVGRGGYVVRVVNGMWCDVVPRRGAPAPPEPRRRVHAAAVRARSAEILAFARTLRGPDDLLDPAVILGREIYVGEHDEGLPNIVIIDFSLERLASTYAKQLRGSGGLQLKRATADAIAQVLEGLAQRSQRTFRKRRAA